jgi:hypothetical protein
VEILLDRLVLLHASDAKTNVCIPVPVEKDFESLEFECTYEPKGYDDEAAAMLSITECIQRFVPEEYRREHRAEYRENLGNPERFLPAVVSLITLSLDYNGRYLGCAHRHAPEQRHIISANFSSPGFFRQPALAGDWRAVINVHSVVCSEVRYHLRVLGGGRDA